MTGASLRLGPGNKIDCSADRSIHALLNPYQEYLVAFKSMTSQVVQRARPLSRVEACLGVKGLKSAGREARWPHG